MIETTNSKDNNHTETNSIFPTETSGSDITAEEDTSLLIFNTNDVLSNTVEDLGQGPTNPPS